MTMIKSRTIGLILLIILGGFLLRIPYYFIYPTHVDDEGSHAAHAVAMMNGGLPYVDFAADNKPPGIFYIYYVTFLLFGKYNMFAIHMMAFLCTLATAMVLGYCAYKISEKKASFLTAMVFYLTFTTTLLSERVSANTEIFMALPYSLAVLLLWLAVTKEKGYLYFLSGVACGLAPLIKQVGGIELVSVLFWLLLIPLFYGKKKWLLCLKTGALLCAGFILPGLIVGLVFYRYGILSDALFWCFTYPKRYVSQGAQNIGFLTPFVEDFIPFFFTVTILWILCGFWIKYAASIRDNQKKTYQFSIFLLLWLLASIAATLIGSRMYPHYFIQILPPLCLIAALGVTRCYTGVTQSKQNYWKIAIVALTFLPGLVFTGIAISYGRENKIPDFLPATEYIKAHTSPEDKIFVWGWASGFYVYSERAPATRFSFTTMLTGYKPGNDPNERERSDITWASAPEAWPMLEADLKRNENALIIDTSPGNRNNFGRYPIKDYPVLFDYVEQNCKMEATVVETDIYRCKSK